MPVEAAINQKLEDEQEGRALFSSRKRIPDPLSTSALFRLTSLALGLRLPGLASCANEREAERGNRNL